MMIMMMMMMMMMDYYHYYFSMKEEAAMTGFTLAGRSTNHFLGTKNSSIAKHFEIYHRLPACVDLNNMSYVIFFII